MDTTTSLPAASERVYEQVKHGILVGTYRGGTLLTEGELAHDCGVSRTPVREALLRLEIEGLLRLYPKKGALVVPVTLEEAREMMEARSLIEQWAAGAAWGARHTLTATLTEHLQRMRAARADAVATKGSEATRDTELQAFAEADRRFHEAIVAAAGNALLLRTYRGLRDRQLCLMAADLRMSTGRMDLSIREHEQLLRELTTGTRAGFVRLTRGHLQGAAHRLRESR